MDCEWFIWAQNNPVLRKKNRKRCNLGYSWLKRKITVQRKVIFIHNKICLILASLEQEFPFPLEEWGHIRRMRWQQGTMPSLSQVIPSEEALTEAVIRFFVLLLQHFQESPRYTCKISAPEGTSAPGLNLQHAAWGWAKSGKPVFRKPSIKHNPLQWWVEEKPFLPVKNLLLC